MKKRRLRLYQILLGAFLLLFLWSFAPVIFINPGKLKEVNPEQTALMKRRLKQAKQQDKPYQIDQRWIPLRKVSRNLQEAVRVAEDGNFFQHSGVDWEEARKSWEINLKRKKISRGASTITMQLARNLYLSPSRNPLRKLQEILIAFRLEKSLSKARILELYLNVVEWGPGIFGAEAAARRYFNKSAASLSRSEAARLAGVLPSPLRWNPASDQRVVIRRMNLVLRLMNRMADPDVREQLEKKQR